MSTPPSYSQAVTALTMSAEEDIAYETIKRKLINRELNTEAITESSSGTPQIMFTNEYVNSHQKKAENLSVHRGSYISHGLWSLPKTFQRNFQ